MHIAAARRHCPVCGDSDRREDNAGAGHEALPGAGAN